MNEVSQVTENPVVPLDPLDIPSEFKRDETNDKDGKKKEVVQVAEDLGTPEVLH